MAVELKRLGDVAHFINGGAWNESEYVASGIPIVRVTDCREGTIDLINCKYLPVSSLARYSKHKLVSGDLVIATVGSHLNQPGSVVGRATLVPKKAQGSLLNQNAVCIRPIDKSLDKRYLGHLGRSPFFREYIIARARGSANHVRMAIGLLKQMPIPLPPLAIQWRIANILSLFDELIENIDQRITILEEIVRLTYRKWFTKLDFPGKNKSNIVGSVLGGIPELWSVQHLADIGESIKETYKEEEHSGLPLLDLAKMRQHTLSFGVLGKPNELSTSRIIFREDDILFGAIRPYLHKVTLAPCQGVTNVSVLVLRPKYDIIKSFLAILLSSNEVIRWADQHSNGLKMPIIKWDDLNQMHVLLPEQSVLSQFHELVAPMLQGIKNFSFRNRCLRQTRDLLLPKLISGDIDVSELDIDIGEKPA